MFYESACRVCKVPVPGPNRCEIRAFQAEIEIHLQRIAFTERDSRHTRKPLPVEHARELFREMMRFQGLAIPASTTVDACGYREEAAAAIARLKRSTWLYSCHTVRELMAYLPASCLGSKGDADLRALLDLTYSCRALMFSVVAEDSAVKAFHQRLLALGFWPATAEGAPESTFELTAGYYTFLRGGNEAKGLCAFSPRFYNYKTEMTLFRHGLFFGVTEQKGRYAAHFAGPYMALLDLCFLELLEPDEGVLRLACGSSLNDLLDIAVAWFSHKAMIQDHTAPKGPIVFRGV